MSYAHAIQTIYNVVRNAQMVLLSEQGAHGVPVIISPVHMASTSQTVSSNGQAMTAQPKLQKPLHAPPRNRKLTIPPTWAIRLEALLVCA